MTKMVGTTAGGMIRPERTRKLIHPFHRDWRRWSTQPTIAASTTMIATDPTVTRVLFTNARTTVPSRVCSTSRRLSKKTNSVGQLNSRSEDSCCVLNAVTTMNANGTRKTTTETVIAMMPTTRSRVRVALTGPSTSG
jgi:hypothetical protein